MLSHLNLLIVGIGFVTLLNGKASPAVRTKRNKRRISQLNWKQWGDPITGNTIYKLMIYFLISLPTDSVVANMHV